jgi:xanthine dehydrogenase YagR molybdenum-binding subunit
MSAVGTPVTRVDGPAKVTGAARYTAEVALPGIAHLAIVGATIASGRVAAVDTRDALLSGGVVAVLSHEDLPPIAGTPHLLPSLLGQAAPGQSVFPLQDDVVHYAGQPVALVVAESHERAQHAASLVRVAYEAAPSLTTIAAGRSEAGEAERLFGGLMPGRNERGDVDAALERADVRIDVALRMAANHHNPLEAPSTVAAWDRGRLTIHESTMGVRATQLTVAHLLGLPLSHVRVITPFVGGSFGMKAMVWPSVTLTAMAARAVGRPLKLMLTRPQMFTSNGHREEQEQRISLGATRDGRLTAIDHDKLSVTSRFDDWAEPATGVSSQLYGVESFRGVHRLIRGNTMTPTFTRGPGEALGVATLEIAMDGLAYELGIDPVELRLRNHTASCSPATTWRTPRRPGRGARRRSTRRTGSSPSARSSPRSPWIPSSDSSASGGCSEPSPPGACSTRCSPAVSSWAGCSGAWARRFWRATTWTRAPGAGRRATSRSTSFRSTPTPPTSRSSSSTSTTTWSARWAPRAWGRSGRWVPPRRSPTRCFTPRAGGSASCRWRPSW